ncbi:MAG TPA: sulfite exporter TauE/SafE family protein [Solirubrobacteraceae bacterium]|nr:sulfite exporter TauE/SafE family protein [Solirubrobacteraceae bacterium]
MDPLVVLFGLGVGVLIGLTGIGGGSLMTPLLILVVGVNPVVAIGTDLAYGAVTKTVGGWRHLRKGTVDLGVSKWLAFGSVPGALAGVALLERLDLDVTAVLALVAVALLVVSVVVLVRSVLSIAPREQPQVTLDARAKATAVAVGAVLGVVLGLTSVGSGALIGPALILLFRLTPVRVVGTDVFHAAILLWAAGLAHWVGGNVDFALMGTILLGSVPGVWIGAALMSRVPVAVLRPLLGCVLLGSALGVLTKAGLDLPAWTIVAAPLTAGIVVWLVHRNQFRKAPEPAWARTS